MNRIQLIFISLAWFFLQNVALAQCIDSLGISPGFNCPDPTYKPVCGCNGQTYRNDCEAKYKNGVQTWTDGTCSGFEMDIIPTYIGPTDYLHFSFSQNKGISATMYIFDYFGKIIHQQFLPAMDNNNALVFQLSFDLTDYRPGIYIFAISNSRGDYRFKKIVKY